MAQKEKKLGELRARLESSKVQSLLARFPGHSISDVLRLLVDRELGSDRAPEISSSAELYDGLQAIGLTTVIPDPLTANYASAIASADFLYIFVNDFLSFQKLHGHGQALLKRFIEKRETKIILPLIENLDDSEPPTLDLDNNFAVERFRDEGDYIFSQFLPEVVQRHFSGEPQEAFFPPFELKGVENSPGNSLIMLTDKAAFVTPDSAHDIVGIGYRFERSTAPRSLYESYLARFQVLEIFCKLDFIPTLFELEPLDIDQLRPPSGDMQPAP